MRIVLLDETFLGIFREFVTQAFPDRHADLDFLRWRYLAEHLTTFIAVEGEQCVGLLSGMTKRYWYDKRIIACIETSDWVVSPREKTRGVGIALMRRMLSLGKPIISLGGTDEAMALLPKLGFQYVADAGNYILPLSGEVVKRRFSGRKISVFAGGVASILARVWWRPRHKVKPANIDIWPVSDVQPEVATFYENLNPGVGLAPIPDKPIMDWLCKRERTTEHFLPFHVSRDDDLVGWALLRIWKKDQACNANIVDVFCPDLSTDELSWVLAEIASISNGYAPECIRALCTNHAVQTALEKNRFVKLKPQSALVHPNGASLPAGQIYLGFNRGDEAFLPMPGKKDLRAAGFSWNEYEL